MKDGFIKVASGTPKIRVADVDFNKSSILQMIRQAESECVKILCLPELCLTGYTCGDLFLQDTLINAAGDALLEILEATRETDMLFALGLPYRYRGKLYNCAAVCNAGRLLALVPKTHLPNYGEFQEARWFSPFEPDAVNKREGRYIDWRLESGAQPLSPEFPTYFGNSFVSRCSSLSGLSVGVEICEDLWAPQPPSAALAQRGATVILNLSASSEGAGKADYRRELVKTQSARLICGYIYSGAGEGESTTDAVFAGHNLIAENGSPLAERRFDTGLVISELDIGRLAHERKRMNTFPLGDCGDGPCFTLSESDTAITREISPTPFVPRDEDERAGRCEEILSIAALGLKKRMLHTGAKKLVIGVSGGLDSTLAMLIAARATDLMGLPREGIIAVTMPGLGTTGRTLTNAEALTKGLGAAGRSISIDKAVRQHFADIGHNESVMDSVYENAQARERTQILMDIANGENGLVVGTGDMSELSLGWATYNGDHMSMYGVNSGIPKTLIRHLVAYCADTSGSEALSATLRDILDTPVSPELLPAQAGEITQRTEDLVGPYELHDFFLYHMIRSGAPPKKVLRMAALAFKGVYDEQTIVKWLRVFIRRFFAQQFKRSCLPDGPRVGSLSLSPRGDWRMPSDAVCSLWLKELEEL